MADIWSRIKQLDGQTIQTAARKKAFTILSVGEERSSLRVTFEQLADLGLKPHELTRSRIDEEIKRGDARNTSYVHTILCAVGKVV